MELLVHRRVLHSVSFPHLAGGVKNPLRVVRAYRWNLEELVGQKVVHEKFFGAGVIENVLVDPHDPLRFRLQVRFSSYPEPKLFAFPFCFKRMLKIQNIQEPDAEDGESVQEQEQEQEQDDETEASQKEDSFEKKKARLKKPVNSCIPFPMPCFHDLKSFCDAFQKAIAEEAESEAAAATKFELRRGRLLSQAAARFIYSFEADQEVLLPNQAPVTLFMGNRKHQGIILSAEDTSIILDLDHNLGSSIEQATMSSSPWQLLLDLCNVLSFDRLEGSSIACSIALPHFPLHKGRRLFTGFDRARTMAATQPVTFIWGPPGTGKTEVLASIVTDCLRRDERVLVLSYSNAAVDGAILRIASMLETIPPGQIVRYGYPRDTRLLAMPDLIAFPLAMKTHPDLSSRQAFLEEELTHTRKSTAYGAEIVRELGEIRSALSSAEEKIVREAPVVCTTLVKSVISDVFRDAQYDTVLVDEASMCFIPYVVYAASLAARHFVCIGDFNQLPPVCTSGSDSIMNADIFEYCHVRSAVDQSAFHPALCLLDTQWRMHPEISRLVNSALYHGLLTDAPGMAAQRSMIAGKPPFPGQAVSYLDVSAFRSLSLKTSSGSRINVMTALLSVGLASIAAKDSPAGVISSFAAQASLMRSISRDIHDAHPHLSDITCSTVHQFQGTEREMIFFDVTESFPSRNPAVLLTQKQGGTANRLLNVAVTRAEGKLVVLASEDYLSSRIPAGYLLTDMLRQMSDEGRVIRDRSMLDALSGSPVLSLNPEEAFPRLLDALSGAAQDILLSMPMPTVQDPDALASLAQALVAAKSRGVSVHILTDRKLALPGELREFAVQHRTVKEPLSVIDQEILFYGVPLSDAMTLHDHASFAPFTHACFLFRGRRCARAIIRLLDLNDFHDEAESAVLSRNGYYPNLSSYLVANRRCLLCGSHMKYVVGHNSHSLVCQNPECLNMRPLEIEDVEAYLHHGNPEVCCPICKSPVLVKESGGTHLEVKCRQNPEHKIVLSNI